MVTPCRYDCRQDKESYRHTQEPIEVLGPHQRSIELRRIELRREVCSRRRGNPRTETPRPIGATEARTGSADESADKNQEVSGRRRPEGDPLER
jgi:hypothetical protein